MVEDELRDIATRLHKASVHLIRTLRREDDVGGLSGPRLSALSVVVFTGPLSLSALAAAEQVRPPTMSRIVDALLAAGLVTRVSAPGDRRSVRIEATPVGRALLDRGRARRVGALMARLSSLTDYERRALARGVEILERIGG